MTKEQDKQIAIKVMGWEIHADPEAPWADKYLDKDGFSINYVDDFHPTTDANDDHIVLKHIRKTWSKDKLYVFTDQLYDMWYDRSHLLLAQYEPGDYSKAALKVTEYDGCYSAVSGEPKVSGGTIKVLDGQKTD